ncbi:MAG: hypothetical protein NTY99_01890 [DPANN group archaeon]|nr:hypothetical protein [DPANN group archaeon]
MAKDLEWMAEQCDNARDTFVGLVARSLQDLSDHMKTCNLEPIFLRRYVDFCEERHREVEDYISGEGIFGHNLMSDEYKYTFETFTKEYLRDNGAKATVELLRRIEARMLRKITQKQSKDLQDKPDYFADWFTKNTDIMWG